MTLRLEQLGLSVAGERYLEGVDLTLEPGRLHVLLGRTGSGKTSLLRVMAGLDRPTTGRLLEGGRDVTGVAPQRRRVAMVYQQFINYPSRTLYHNIATPLARQGLGSAEIRRRVLETAAILRIDHLLDRLPAEVSGGQQQRCAIARALAKDAGLLLLDEPLVNLDYKLREELRAELKGLFAKREAVVVYASTEPAEALVMGGVVIVMDEGRVLQTGKVIDVYDRPASIRVAEVLSDPPMNTIDGRLEPGLLTLADGLQSPPAAHMEGLPAGAYRFGVRSGQVALGSPLPGELGARGMVELAEISGSETYVHVHHHGVSWVVRQEGVHGLALGQPVEIRLDPAKLFVFAPDGRLCAAPARATAG